MLFSSPRVTEMFQFTRFPLPALCVQTGVTLHDECRVSPFGHPRIKAHLAAPRGLSQLVTSFIGSRRQGIHRWLFVAWKNKDARARYAILKGREEVGSEEHDLVEGNSLKTEQRTTDPGAPAAGDRDLRPCRWHRERIASASTGSGASREAVLIRKEVIQPHLPVRLPCYDFTPIANPTFDSSFPKGLGHWLRVLPTFVV